MCKMFFIEKNCLAQQLTNFPNSKYHFTQIPLKRSYLSFTRDKYDVDFIGGESGNRLYIAKFAADLEVNFDTK